MTGKAFVTKVALLLCLAVVTPTIAQEVDSAGKRVTKQIHTKASIINSDEDHKAAESGFGGATIGANGKYFHDIYVHKYGPDQIEFGHVSENPDEWEQRFERKDGHRRLGKVRWGDKHGGYGEHYYDYNHGGHEAADGGDEGGDGHYSEPVPTYNEAPGERRVTAKRHLEAEDADAAAARLESDRVLAHDVSRLVKREPTPVAAPQEPRLVFDLASGKVIDEVTGRAYALQPIN